MTFTIAVCFLLRIHHRKVYSCLKKLSAPVRIMYTKIYSYTLAASIQIYKYEMASVLGIIFHYFLSYICDYICINSQLL